MKTICPSLLVFCACIWAADFWQAKPFTDWSDKEVQKILTNSPWAKSIGVSLGGPAAVIPGGAVDSPGAGGRSPGGAGQEVAPPISEQGGRGGRGAVPAASAPSAVSVDVVVRWQSALSVKQALARMKYGAEAGSSAEAKEALDRQEADFLIVATGAPLRDVLRGDPEVLKTAILGKTALSVKGRNPLKPSDIQFHAAGRTFEVYFTFPRSEMTLQDNEIEFATRIGDLPLKTKFQLKNMVRNGKLEI